MADRRSIAATLLAELRGRGVRRMFGLPGGGASLDLIEAGAELGIDFVLALSETAAAIMAATTAELSGTPGVVLTGLGPGAASVTNGLAHAALDRVPLVLMSDAYPPEIAAWVTHQRIDQPALFAPLVKASLAPSWATTLAELRQLLDLAMTAPQGPVHIDFSASAALASLAETDLDQPALADAAVPRQIETAWGLLERAERPVLLIGLQARRAPVAARALAEALGGPVLTTWKAKGVVSSDHPLFVGLFTGAEAEALCVAEADLIVQFGFDPVELIPRPWRYHAPIIDISDVAAQTHYARPSAAVIGPLEEGAAALGGVRRRGGWSATTIESFHRRIAERYRMAPSAAISPQAVARRRSRSRPPAAGPRSTPAPTCSR